MSIVPPWSPHIPVTSAVTRVCCIQSCFAQADPSMNVAASISAIVHVFISVVPAHGRGGAGYAHRPARTGGQALAAALDYQSNYWFAVGDLERAITLADRALVIAEDLNDVGLTLAARAHLGLACYESGDYDRAAGSLLENVNVLGDNDVQERFGLAVPMAEGARAWLALCLAEKGEFQEAIKRAKEARRLAELTGHHFDIVYALRSQIFVFLGRGDLETVVSLSEQLLALRSEGLATGRLTAAALGFARALRGRLEEGRSLIEEALNVLTSAGRKTWLALFFVWRGEVLGLQGLLEEAEEQVQGALALAREGGYRGYQAYALRLLAELASRRSLHSTASTRYGEASRWPSNSACAPSSPTATLASASSTGAQASGRSPESISPPATMLYREMEMRFWLEQAEPELAE